MAGKRRWAKLFVGISAGAVVLIGLALFWGYRTLQASLPALEGDLELEGLSAPASVDRDDRGIPTLRAGDRVDLARVLGFLHAQERFFQMDLMRRQSAGELAELVGSAALDADRSSRLHRFRSRASRVVAEAPPEHRALLEAYTGGVNQGLARLRSKPFEYHLLRAEPEPWRPEDTVLVLYSMFFVLNDEHGAFESTLGVLYDIFPAEAADFLAPNRSEWDAPIVGEVGGTRPIPGPEVLDLRRRQSRFQRHPEPLPLPAGEAFPGSNNWALAGSRTASRRALIANDMHLGGSVPNTWYRAVMETPELWLAGLTLPGVPILVTGSNGTIAWGFTNSTGDWSDLIVLDRDPDHPGQYLTPEGFRPFEIHPETIRVKGREPEVFEVEETIWGPVIDQDHHGRQRSLSWIAHHPEAVNLRHLEIETARSLEAAMDAANRSGIPPQNFVCGDREGRIAWTIEGAIPRRAGFDGRLPRSWADGTRGWEGWLSPSEYPRIVDPPSGMLWTANARVVDGEMLARIGDGGYDLGARARQIRDGLASLTAATEAEMLAIQLDDRALFLQRWRDLALAVLGPGTLAGRPRRADFRRLLEVTWTGRASVDSVAYRLVRAFRVQTFYLVYGWLTLPCKEADPRFRPELLGQWEDSLWALVNQQPEHLLDPAYSRWNEVLLEAVDQVLEALPGDLEQRTWGERNTYQPRHPLTHALPLVGRWLNMPTRQLPGDNHMPRVQWLDGGSSERTVVSPGREDQGYFHMPGGQSGHPLSDHYQAGHDDWAAGRPAPFLPGEPRKRLVFRP